MASSWSSWTATGTVEEASPHRSAQRPAQRDLALAKLDLVSGMTIYEKAKVELDRATGTTLEHNGILIQDAISGVASQY